jgi:hypothetical protein
LAIAASSFSAAALFSAWMRRWNRIFHSPGALSMWSEGGWLFCPFPPWDKNLF